MTTTTDRPAPASPASPAGAPPGFARRVLRGRADDPRWVRPTLAALLAATALTYLWNLGASGNANSFYAAAVQAGSRSWKAWLFGALDAPGAITVDKPPAAFWLMGLSARIFGYSSWSMLVPQALLGVATVALTYATVRRWSGPRTALAAAALLAATPVAVLMFRFNNPDALLVLCMVAAAWATTRAVDAAGSRAGTGWMVAAGALLGLGFLTKMLQVALVVPALALAFLVVADTSLRRRVVDLLAGGAAMVVSAGWYVLLVALWPAGSRPFIGGSTTNSLLELALGYNGLARLLGRERGGAGGPRGGPGGAPPGGAAGGPGAMGPGGPGGMGPGGPGGGGGFGGSASPWRMFTEEFAGQASWLLPAALIVLVAGLWAARGRPRTDRSRGLLLLGGTWTVVHVAVFSAMSGTIHPYYAVAMAPGIALTVAGGAAQLWRRRERLAARLVLAATVLVTAGWSAVVLTEVGWAPGLRWVVVTAGVLGAVGLALAGPRRARGLTIGAVTLSLVGALGAPAAYAGVTAAVPHQGSIVSAGPSGSAGPGGGRTGGRGAGRDGRPDGRDGTGRAGTAGGGMALGGTAGGGMGGPQGQTPPPALVALLRGAGTRWSAATTGAMSAAPLELASDTSVISMGGFMGSDPYPTLAQFQQLVTTGQVRYLVVGDGPGGPGMPGGPRVGGPGAGGDGARRDGAGGDGAGRRAGGPGSRGASEAIDTWVAQHYTATSVGGRTVYDLSRPRG